MKLRHTPSFPFQTPSAFRYAFTLIELLVVIAIIAVLAGLLFPVMGSVRNSARKVSATSDCTQMVTAIKNFQVDYGKYPGTAGGNGAVSNKEIVAVLTATETNAGNPGDPSTVQNRRKIRYIEVKRIKDDDDDGASKYVYEYMPSGGGPRSAVYDTTGEWYDPWGIPYEIFIDRTYSGNLQLSGKSSRMTKLGTEVDGIEVGAASSGPPTRQGANWTFPQPAKSW